MAAPDTRSPRMQEPSPVDQSALPAVTGLERHCRVVVAVVCVLVVALVYWSVRDGGFVGVVDRAYFHDFAWLRTGQSWHDILFRNAYNWSNYYRPLVVALFVIEERLFDVAPGPMHLVSLAIHLANVLLVGALGRRLLERSVTATRACVLSGVAMLAYGLHPALVEPVVTVACQFDLVALLFVLLGLLAHTSNLGRPVRALSVGACFFLGACSKESAVALPMLAVIADWTRVQAGIRETFRQSLRRLIRDEWPSYVAILLAGLAYLGMRHYALGYLLQGGTTAAGSVFDRFQMVCSLYLTYWRLLLWPMTGISPVHEGDVSDFSRMTGASIAVDAVAVAIALSGICLLWRSGRSRSAGLIAAVTVALLPVLRIVPIDFDSSLYHERYAMTAVAAGCLFLPAVLLRALSAFDKMRVARATAGTVVAGWLAASALNVAVTVPLWQDDVKLWQWVVARDPNSLLAKNFLLNAHLSKNEISQARLVANSMAGVSAKCPVCLLNIANLSVRAGDMDAAQAALDRAAPLLPRLKQPRMFASFGIIAGQVREARGDLPGAEKEYRRSLELEPLDPGTRMRLAIALVRQGRRDEASAEASRAVDLMAPDDRESHLEEFRRAMADALTEPGR